MPTGTHDGIRRERRSNWERCLGGQRVWDERGYHLAVGWAVWRRYYLSAASSCLGSRRRSGGEGAGSPSRTTRIGMEPAIETWWSTMAGKAGRSVFVNRTGSFVRLSLIFLHSFLHRSFSFDFYISLFPHVYLRSFEYFLILLLLQCNDPIPQTRSLLFRFCGYRRRTVLALLDIFSTEEPLLAESCPPSFPFR
jgi:hypothetical protein